MKHKGCPYRAGLRGRSMTIKQGAGGVRATAHVECSRCPTKAGRQCRSDQTPHQLDAAFRHAGWRLDPHVCPDCQQKETKERNVSAAKPSTAAMKAQVQMFTLLSAWFDADKGAYATGWNDQRVAKETGLALDLVVEYRRTGFGELKEPSEVAALRNDINALEALQRESAASFAQGVAELRAKLARVSERFAA
jgi:hypothetical protein